jgi:hypothetical protein
MPTLRIQNVLSSFAILIDVKQHETVLAKQGPKPWTEYTEHSVPNPDPVSNGARHPNLKSQI